jgi:hypothetical protein
MPTVWLDLPQPIRTDNLQACDAIGQTPLIQCLQPGKLGWVSRDDHLPAPFGGNAFLLTVGIYLARALHAEARLERAGRIVDAGMDDAAVVRGLVLADRGLLFQHRKPESRVPPQQFPPRGQPDDARTQNSNVVTAHV